MANNGDKHHWDKEVDVIVVGYGAAGGISAITAHDAGAKVLLIEKMPHPGGISMLSGGGVAFAHNAEGAFQYLKRTCNGTTPDDILRKMADEMVGMIDWLTELAKVSGTEPTKTETRGHGTYPFPGTNDIDSIKLKDFPAYSEFPWAKGLRGGARLFKVVYDNVNTRKIEVMLATPAKELITSSNGEVIGLVAEHDGKALRIKAKKGVILACGGYENDDAMKLQYFEAQPGIFGLSRQHRRRRQRWRRKLARDFGTCGTFTAATVLNFPSCPSRFATSGPDRETKIEK